MTEQDRARLRELAGRITPGEWLAHRYPGSTDSYVWTGEPGDNAKLICGDGSASDEDAEFIALVRNNLAEIIAALEEAGRMREALREIAASNKEHHFTATQDNPETHWEVADGPYAKIARAALGDAA